MNRPYNYGNIQETFLQTGQSQRKNMSTYACMYEFNILEGMIFMNVQNFLFHVISEVNLNILYSKPRTYFLGLVFLIIIWLLIRRVRRACICSWNLCVCVCVCVWFLICERNNRLPLITPPRQHLLTLLRECVWTTNKYTGQFTRGLASM